MDRYAEDHDRLIRIDERTEEMLKRLTSGDARLINHGQRLQSLERHRERVNMVAKIIMFLTGSGALITIIKLVA